MKFAFIIDPISKLDPTHDSSVAIMEAAQILGHEIWITYISDLSIVDGKAYAHLQPLTLQPVKLVDNHWVAENNWYSLHSSQFLPLETFDGVFMRKDPPVTIPYLYATYILDLINPQKTKVINSPQGIRCANEKIYALNFTSVIPDTIVSQNKSVIADFLEAKGEAVIKPLGGKAGEGILFLEKGDRNFNSLIEVSTKQGQEPVMVQQYLPAAKEGDKRIIIVNGKPLGAVNRIPTGKEFRGNMAVGGRVAKTEITPEDLKICHAVAPRLMADGLTFVGIDVIGGYLTEVNVTSPTGIREIDFLNNVSLGKETIYSLFAP
ncbi:glutathione synthase [Cyanobacterium stanieri LEGE 03274]|uniref:Glutathione synthetase n=1 Tax=Cyanobacterium stanieri LEGE 03274 TaxID=1828756 RepID=A0ABR9V7L9_9CHRO|nr:glutathione synthase [Cyanobacterium stanieri]MBE9223516.1 glutathione synthase [Cyanobacterium stanieri LEGE 03274]